MGIGRLENESPEYRKLRDELSAAEIALKEQRERVAELRRRLPADTPVEDYVLREVPAPLDGDAPEREVRLSELFDDGGRPVVLMQFMYGKAQEEPCPMCTGWADGYDGIVAHLNQNASFGVLVAGDAKRFREYARERGWRNLRVLSAGESSLKRDLGFETPDGSQIPGVSVFTRGADGSPRHFYSSSAVLDNGEYRGMDLLSPLWHFLDLTPAGRGDFMPRRSYA